MNRDSSPSFSCAILLVCNNSRKLLHDSLLCLCVLDPKSGRRVTNFWERKEMEKEMSELGEMRKEGGEG